MRKAIYLEKDHRDIVNVYGDVTGSEYDVFFDDIFVGTVSGNSYGPYGCNSGMFRDCQTTSPLSEIAEKLGIELIDDLGKPIAKCW